MVAVLPISLLLQHLWVVGGSGTGKTSAARGWLMQLIENGYGCGIIDPHGDLYQDVFTGAAGMNRRVRERIVLFDPLHPTHSVGLNPLELLPGDVPARKADFLANVVSKIFGADPASTPRMQQMLRHTFWLLMISKRTLLEFPFVLNNQAYREALLACVPPSEQLLLDFWLYEFPADNPRLVHEWTQSSLNKIRPFVSDPAMQLIFGQQRSTINFRQIMDEGLVLLVNLHKGKLGDNTAHLLGAFILAQIQLAALSREEIPQDERRQWTLFVDEFQNVLTDDVEEILTETRKYGLALMIANQYYEQLDAHPKLQAAVLNSVRNWAVFRLGAKDSELFGRDLFNPSLDMVKDVRTRYTSMGTEEDIVWRPLGEIEEMMWRQVKNLADREFWFLTKGKSQAAIKLRTRTLKKEVLRPRHVAQLEELSALNLSNATPHDQVWAEIARRYPDAPDSNPDRSDEGPDIPTVEWEDKT